MEIIKYIFYVLCLILIMASNTRLFFGEKNYSNSTYTFLLVAVFLAISDNVISASIKNKGFRIILIINIVILLFISIYRHLKKIKVFSIYNIKKRNEEDIFNIIDSIITKYKLHDGNIVLNTAVMQSKIIFKNTNNEIIEECITEINEYIQECGRKNKLYLLYNIVLVGLLVLALYIMKFLL